MAQRKSTASKKKTTAKKKTAAKRKTTAKKKPTTRRKTTAKKKPATKKKASTKRKSTAKKSSGRGTKAKTKGRKKSAAKKKSAAGKTKSAEEKAFQDVVSDAIEKELDALEDTQKRLRKLARETTRGRGAQVALKLLDLEKTTFDNAMKVINNLEERSDKGLKNYLDEADWMPREGKEVVDEWVKTLRRGSNDFRKSVDKSFRLLSNYFERVKNEDKKK